MHTRPLSIAITGAGGAGVISCGELLLQGWARQGGLGLLRKAYGPQIRGGEAAALLKLTGSERYTAATQYDLIVALDWDNFSRFEDEIQLGPDSWVLCEPGANIPVSVAAANPRLLQLDMAELTATAHPDGRVNMVVLGILGTLLGVPTDSLCELAGKKLRGKPQSYRDAALACIEHASKTALECHLQVPACDSTALCYLSGNQAVGLGALEAGVRFVAAYPITPASDVLEWMAGGLERVGGKLVQAEDELAAINMTIGAAFGGVPALTATSGPGLALMTESIGLAVASETPVTVINVMRGGPSTGIPTKSEQSDLNIALYGLHGDAPHLVFAALDIADCVFTTSWAVQLAQHLQTAAIVLSDQFIGQSTAVISEPRRCRMQLAATASADPEEIASDSYQRYLPTDSGVSSLAIPGETNRRYTADGLEHNALGTPSASQSDHLQQLDKRQRKLSDFDFGGDWAEIAGSGELALICFGSCSAAINEAADLLRERDIATRSISLRLLAPLQVADLSHALAGCEQVIVVEQNHGAQLLHYLQGHINFQQAVHSYAMPGPVPLDPANIAQRALELMNHDR